MEKTTKNIHVICNILKNVQSRQKCYADLNLWEGDYVFLKASPMRGVTLFDIMGKLALRYVGPFEIFERVGDVSYRLNFPL